MRTITVGVGSVTYAIKARRLIERSGIKTKLIKTASSPNDRGCQYGIVFSENQFYDVIALLRNNGIEYSVFRNISKYDLF